MSDLPLDEIEAVADDAAYLRGLALRISERCTPAMGFDQGDCDRLSDIANQRTTQAGEAATDNSALVEELEKALPLLKDLETGQDCEDYAYAKGDGFQAMTYIPEAFEALRRLPDAIAALKGEAS